MSRVNSAAVLAVLAATAVSAQGVRTVDVVTVTARALARTRTLPGEFLPYDSVPLHAKVTGFVNRVDVDRGSVVKRGQVLMTIVAPELVAQRAEAEAKLAAVKSQQVEAQAKLAGAQNTYDELKTASATKGAVAENELVQAQKALDAIRASVETLDAQARAAKAAVDAQRELQSYLRITAPFDGVITERNVSPGALVGPQAGAGAPPLLKLEDLRRLRLVVAVPEADVSAIRVFVIRVRNGRAEWVDVKRGGADKDLVEVFGDLKAGDQVVARASDEIRNGAGVTPRR